MNKEIKLNIYDRSFCYDKGSFFWHYEILKTLYRFLLVNGVRRKFLISGTRHHGYDYKLDVPFEYEGETYKYLSVRHSDRFNTYGSYEFDNAEQIMLILTNKPARSSEFTQNIDCVFVPLMNSDGLDNLKKNLWRD